MKNLRHFRLLVEGRFITTFSYSTPRPTRCSPRHPAGAEAPDVDTAASEAGKTTVLINPAVKDSPAGRWYYCTAETPEGLEEAVYGEAIDAEDWTELASSGAEITPPGGHRCLRLVETDADGKPLARGDAALNLG
jgi:hypothetical protein